uniref:Uncharacterized protein n=1 Tax=viral metagenome TaxID=1070528 RepID=A0A6C0CBI1_9ZZZZ
MRKYWSVKCFWQEIALPGNLNALILVHSMLQARDCVAWRFENANVTGQELHHPEI